MTPTPDDDGRPAAKPLLRVAEGILIGAACAGPWMFGAVDAWAEIVLLGAAVAAALCVAMAGGVRLGRRSAAVSVPGLALAGLIALGAFQASPLPSGVLRVVDPSGAALRAALLPERPEVLRGDDRPPVPLPPATISQAAGLTREATGRVVAVWLLFLAAAGLGRGPGPLRRFGVALALNGAALGLFSLVQALNWNGKIYGLVPSPHGVGSGWSGGGPFVCHSHLAEYLNLGLGVALGALLAGGFGGDGRGPRRQGWVWPAYLAGVLLLGVITSNSRGGAISAVVAGLIVAVGLRARLDRGRAWALGAGCLALLGLYLAVLGDASPYLARLGTVLDPDNEGYQTRLGVWREALSAWRAHPVAGAGLGAFEHAAGRFFAVDRAASFSRAENSYVEMLVEGGLVGLGLSLGALAGVARLAGRAMGAATATTARALPLGALAGVSAVLLQCLGDFGLYIPAVLFPLVVLCGHLTRLGLEAGGEDGGVGGLLCRPLAAVAVLGLGIGAVLVPAWGRVEAEAWVRSAGLPPPDTESPPVVEPPMAVEAIRARRDALSRAVALRPGWVEGALRLGLAELSLYRATADDWLAAEVADPAERAVMADPLWLLELVRQGAADPATIAEQEPVRESLMPAARAFLEARRRSYVAAAPHAQLAALGLLFDPPRPARVEVERLLRTAGPDARLLLFGARVALRSGETGLASACWRRALGGSEAAWALVQREADGALTPAQLLDDVIPPGRARFALELADRPGLDPPTRDRALRFAAENMPLDLGLPVADRLYREARAWAALGDRPTARARIEAAMASEPGRFEFRQTLIEWLLAWGDPTEAHNQALVGAQLSAERPEWAAILERTSEAVARGGAAP